MGKENTPGKEKLPDSTMAVAQILLATNAVELMSDSPFVFASGIKSPMYTDARRLISFEKSYPVVTRFLCESILGQFGDGYKDYTVSATAVGGVPWGAWVANYLDLPFVYVGKGKNDQMEIAGLVTPGRKMLIIEDLITTGRSAIENARKLREAGLIVNDCFAVFTYEFTKSLSNLAEANLTLHSLCGFSALTCCALESGNLNERDYRKLLQWWYANSD
ncbi:MAG: orotate phosphoribosyltransferase [Patescibacteria group bacterium]|nr:orotate phosphoribosyltransferase [Patescibacteria group bacterium]